MKNYFLLIIAFLLTAAAASKAESGENFVINGGFEENIDDWESGAIPYGWRGWEMESLQPDEISLDRDIKHSGEASVRFTDARHGLSQHIRVHSGEVYDFSCFVKTNTTRGGLGFWIWWIDAEGQWVKDPETDVQIVEGVNSTGTFDHWREVNINNITVPENAVMARIGLAPVYEPQGTYWVDDVTMRQAAGGEAEPIPYRNAMLSWFDPERVLGNKLYVANDMPMFKPFLTRNNFGEGVGGPQLIERAERAVDLILELPEGVRPTYVVQFIRNWRDWDPVAPAKAERVAEGGEVFFRYRFELPAIFNNQQNGTLVLFETDLPAGTQARGKGYLEWEGGRQPAQALEIEVITIGRVSPFKRLFNGIYYAEGELLLTWLPELARDYPQIGFNRLEIDPAPSAPRKPWVQRLVGQAREGQLYMATSPSQSTPWGWYWTSRDPDARAVDRRGNAVMEARWEGSYSLCPLYRGQQLEEHLSKFLNGPVFTEYGLNWLALDLELWDNQSWEAGCFCSRCLTAYGEFAAKHDPDAAPGDPRVFMEDPAAHPAEAARWKAFREWCLLDFARALREPIEELVAREGGKSAPRPGLLVSEWRSPHPSLFGVVDYFEVNCYYKPAEAARRLGEAVETSAGRKNIVAALSTGQSHGDDATLSDQDMLHKIYESAVAGVQGMVWYDVTGLNAWKLKMMVDGFRTIRPFEDMILDGTCTVSIATTPKPASARRITLNNESLLLIRNYDGGNNTAVEVTLPEALGTGAAIYDAVTLAPVEAPAAGERVIKLTLGKDEARLLYLGTEAQWKARLAEAAWVADGKK